ncbi:hypothetical protein [Stenotrophomonas sp.]|uniref:hypothetical protein n=1 Tax=Stenotrophomonas sp. TaxID=69392 RepID=UPI00289AEE56|nr:hypothetical protein [Stenotrophomonas sp.]
MKELPTRELEEIARLRTQRELEDYVIPDEIRGNVSVTMLFEDGQRVFLLYVPGKTRLDPRIIARTTVDAMTGEATVEVLGLERI